MMVLVISSIVLIMVASLSFKIPNLESSAFAQSNSTTPLPPIQLEPVENLTTQTLPPVQLEPVDPQDIEDSNSTSTSGANNVGYLSYEDSDIGFKIEYPSEWDVKEADLTNNAIVVFSPPDGSVEVDIKSFARTDSMSLKTFGDNFFKKGDSFRISSYYRNSTTLLGGEPAIRTIATLIYSPNFYESLRGEESTTQKILAMTALLKEKKSFLQVIYYADKSNFMDYLPQVEHMIESFQFQNTKPIIQEDD
jgi:hypothetical protein